MTGSSTTDLPSVIIIGSSTTVLPSSVLGSRSTTSVSWSGASGHLGAGIGAGSGFATEVRWKFGQKMVDLTRSLFGPGQLVRMMRADQSSQRKTISHEGGLTEMLLKFQQLRGSTAG